jgi:hypothetical protein
MHIAAEIKLDTNFHTKQAWSHCPFLVTTKMERNGKFYHLQSFWAFSGIRAWLMAKSTYICRC